MAATVSSVFRGWAHVCYLSFPLFTGYISALLGVTTTCLVVRGKCWPLAFSVFFVCFNEWFLYPAIPLQYFVFFPLQRCTIPFRKGLALGLGCVRIAFNCCQLHDMWLVCRVCNRKDIVTPLLFRVL